MARKLKKVTVTFVDLHIQHVNNDGRGHGFISRPLPDRLWNNVYKHPNVAREVIVAALEARWPKKKRKTSKVAQARKNTS